MKKKTNYFKSVSFGVIASLILLGACSNKKNNSGIKNNKDRTLVFSDSVAFLTAAGDTAATVAVAIADELQERALGLMYYTDLKTNQGMLFIFQEEKPESFWMANTPLSLDMFFINSDKEIVRIHHSTPPFSKENFASGAPALYVIETNGGFAIAHDIREGMKVSF